MSTQINPCGYRRLSFIILVCLSITANMSVGATTEVDTDNPGFSNAWTMINAVADQLIAEHINPPARQQMFLSSCRGLFVATNKLPPQALCVTFSKCLTDQDFEREFRKVWDEQSKLSGLAPDQLQQLAVNALLKDCESGISLVNLEDSRVQKQLAENQYVGIGIQLNQTEDGWPNITNPFYGGAAQKAGARAGDRIVAIDGVSTHNRDFSDVVDDLRGPKGSQLVVSLRHASETEDRVKTMIRDVVPIASVVGREQDQDDGTWTIALPNHPDVALVKIETIVGSTSAEMLVFARRIEKGKFKGVVLDFRGQRGRTYPQVHHAIMLIDSLIREHKIGDIVTNSGATEIRAQNDAVMTNIPISVLCDPVVSGPLFFVLASLQSSGKAKIVGTTIQSNGLCKKSIEIDDRMGTLEGVSYAVAIPAKVKIRDAASSSDVQNEHRSGSGLLAPRFDLAPDVRVDQADSNPSELLEAAVKALRE